MKTLLKLLWIRIVAFLEAVLIMPIPSDDAPVQHMAKVKFSAFLSDMRNKLNGSVFSRNRGGAYVRNKVTPLNPQTTAQVAARALLASFSQSWRSLTAAERTAWNSSVENFATTDIFGDLRNPSGQQLYIRLNVNISNAGGVAITSPPAPVGADAVSLFTAVYDTVTGLDFTFTPTPIPALHTMYIEGTESLSAGINNANSRFRFIAIEPAAGVSPLDETAAQLAKFGALVVGGKYFWRAKFIRTDTGEVSQSLVTSAIAT